MNITDKNASHLPVFEFLYSLKKFEKVMEFGCGLYSTSFFIRNAKSILSIEQKSKAWFEKISKECGSSSLDIRFIPGEESVRWLKKHKKKYDLIFVDGIVRTDCVNNSFGKAPIIVIHDIGLRAIKLGYLKQIVPNDYAFGFMNISHPSTSLWIKDDDLMKKVKNHKLFHLVKS